MALKDVGNKVPIYKLKTTNDHVDCELDPEERSLPE